MARIEAWTMGLLSEFFKRSWNLGCKTDLDSRRGFATPDSGSIANKFEKIKERRRIF
jgi:hypothetical protein